MRGTRPVILKCKRKHKEEGDASKMVHEKSPECARASIICSFLILDNNHIFFILIQFKIFF
jgi:hypothetical protein